MSELRLSGEVTLQAAADGKQPRIAILAYGGGIIRPSGWTDLVVDVAGISAAGQLPLLLDHDATTDGVVGHGAAIISNGKIQVDGQLIGGIPATDKLLALHRGGLRLQASIGLDPAKQTRLKPGEKITVNKQTITAGERGLTVVSAGILREVSILPVAADGTTNVSIAAKGTSMTENESIVENPEEALLAAERERVSSIVERCGPNHKVASQAIKAGWDADRAELECRRQARPVAPAIHTARDHGASPRAMLSASLMLRMGQETAAVKTHGERAVEAARRSEGIHSLVDLCRMALHLEHVDIPSDRGEMLRAAFSTTTLPSAISDGIHAATKAQYQLAPQTFKGFAAVRSASDFRSHSLVQANLAGGLDRIGAGGAIHHSSLDTSSYSFSIDTYAKMFTLTRRDLLNDHISLFADLPTIFATQASRRLSDLVYETLLANAGSFYSAGNSNYLSGGSSALSVTSLTTAVKTMRTQRNNSSEKLDLGIVPAVLLVPPALEQIAKGLVESDILQSFVDATTTQRSQGNPFRGTLSVETESRLSNDRFTNASATGWYLMSAPMNCHVITAFLDGDVFPKIEFFGLDHNAETLGVSWRCYHDFGCALADPRGGVLSAGA